MPKCRFCKMLNIDGQTICSCCRLPLNKTKKELTPPEKRIARYCRAMRSLSYLAVFNGVCMCIWGLIELFLPQLRMKSFFALSWGIFNVYYGISLHKYKRWCFYGGIVLYGYGLGMGLVYRHWLAVIVSILFLSYVINPVSRKILMKIR